MQGKSRRFDSGESEYQMEESSKRPMRAKQIRSRYHDHDERKGGFGPAEDTGYAGAAMEARMR